MPITIKNHTFFIKKLFNYKFQINNRKYLQHYQKILNYLFIFVFIFSCK